MTFHIPASWRVFVLDDSEERLEWFRARVPQMRAAKTASAAIALLSEETFDVVFLDHDLSFMDAGFPDRQFDNGKEVARFLEISKFAGRVVIHSKNEAGVAAMKKILPEARIARFDDFEITSLPAPAPACAAPRQESV
jgi:hypothetical protein